MNIESHLLAGTIDADGRVEARPVIALIPTGGVRVAEWRYLEGHEPAFTTQLNALLHLPTLTLKRL